MFHYSVHGVTLDSDTALPELDALVSSPQAERTPIKIKLNDAEAGAPLSARWFLRSALSDGDDAALCGKIDAGYLLRYVGLADFIVDATGTEVRCIRTHPGIIPQILRHLLLDRVLPLVLNLRGYDVIHATAVETPAGVCVFIGPAGAGKSTLAASFAAVGYSIVCDDCLVVRVDDGILCTPGYPGLRLWSDSFSVFTSHFMKANDATCSPSKFRLLTNSPHCPGRSRPLKAIFRINRAANGRPVKTLCVRRLSGCEAFVELASSAFLLDVTQPSTLRRHFRFIERLLARIHVSRLLLPTDFDVLPAARRLIVNEIESA